jgi:hypothetical protein
MAQRVRGWGTGVIQLKPNPHSGNGLQQEPNEGNWGCGYCVTYTGTSQSPRVVSTQPPFGGRLYNVPTPNVACAFPFLARVATNSLIVRKSQSRRSKPGLRLLRRAQVKESQSKRNWPATSRVQSGPSCPTMQLGDVQTSHGHAFLRHGTGEIEVHPNIS